MKIKLDSTVALGLLADNKAKHIKEFALQLEGWKEAMEAHSSFLTQWATSGGILEERPIEPQKPRDFTDAYDKYLDMIKFHTEDTLIIDEGEFDEIVKDEFHWKSHFVSNTALYGGKNGR